MADSKLDIELTIAADTAGATQAEAALKGVQAASTGGAKAAQTQAAAANQLGENFEKGAAAGRVLSEVSRGNVLALGQLGAALKTIGVLLKTNLIGALFTLGAVAANVLLPIIAGFIKQKKTVEDSTKAVEAASEAVKALGKQRLETLQTALALLDKTATSTLNELNAALDSAEKLASARDRLALAEIEADTSLSPIAKVQARAAIAEAAAARSAETEQKRAEGVVTARRKAAEEASALESAAADSFGSASGRAGSSPKLRTQLEAELVAAQAAVEEARKKSPIGVPAGDETLRVREIKDRLELLDRPDAQVRAAATAADQTAAAEALDKANAAALASAEALAEAEADLARLRADQAAVSPIDRQTRAVEVGTQLRAIDDPTRAAAARAFETQTGPGLALGPKEGAAVAARAGQINAAAAAQAGVQAGESIGDAFGLALKELFPAMTEAVIRTTQRQIDAAVKAEVARLEAQVNTRLQTQRTR